MLAELEEVYDEAVQAYERAVKLGVERAQQNLRNVRCLSVSMSSMADNCSSLGRRQANETEDGADVCWYRPSSA